MGTDILNLQHELEQTRSSLKNVDEQIKKLIGRDPSELPPRPLKRPIPDEKGRPSGRLLSRIRNFTHENEEPLNKRRNNTSVFSRLSDKVPDDVPQKGLISKVIVTNKEIPSREEALKAQNKDEKFRARNKRMFGALLGTLQKFQQEETKLKQREDKRAQLEKKIEEHEIKEKEEIRRERQELFFNRKKKQAEIRIIELKMLRMKEYSSWDESQKPRKHFILTKTKPHIHYLPRRLTDKTKELLAESKADVDKLIEKKKQQISEELQHIEERIKRNFDYKFNQKDGKGIEHDQDTEERDQETEEHLEDVLAESQIALEKQKDVENETVSKECSEEDVEKSQIIDGGTVEILQTSKDQDEEPTVVTDSVENTSVNNSIEYLVNSEETIELPNNGHNENCQDADTAQNDIYDNLDV